VFFPSELGAANDAMDGGRYAEAASLYEGAATESRAAGDTLTFRMMAVLAVKAYGRAGDTENAVRLAVTTVDLLQGLAMIPEIPGVAHKMLAALRAQGHAVSADGISTHVAQVVGAAWSDAGATKLPAFCASCGAAVKPAEIVHPSPSSVACRYCGASLAR
jgi:hypothetical protein